MGEFRHHLLDLSRMEMLRKTRLKPRSRAHGAFSGRHESRYRGTSVEFADYRDYAVGDDIRQIDWKVYARSDKHYVRLYEAERNFLSYMLVDVSGSMAYEGTLTPTVSKLEYAARLAAALGYIVIREGDQAGMSLAGEKIVDYLPPRSGWPHLSALVDSLAGAKATGLTSLEDSLSDLYNRISRRGTLLIFSDFLNSGDGFWNKIDLFRRSQFDIILFHIVHPEELELPDLPAARFVDPEAGGGHFRAEPEEIRTLYKQRFEKHLKLIEAGCSSRGCEWFLGRTDNDAYLFLKQCFLERGGE